MRRAVAFMIVLACASTLVSCGRKKPNASAMTGRPTLTPQQSAPAVYGGQNPPATRPGTSGPSVSGSATGGAQPPQGGYGGMTQEEQDRQLALLQEQQRQERLAQQPEMPPEGARPEGDYNRIRQQQIQQEQDLTHTDAANTVAGTVERSLSDPQNTQWDDPTVLPVQVDRHGYGQYFVHGTIQTPNDEGVVTQQEYWGYATKSVGHSRGETVHEWQANDVNLATGGGHQHQPGWVDGQGYTHCSRCGAVMY